MGASDQDTDCCHEVLAQAGHAITEDCRELMSFCRICQTELFKTEQYVEMVLTYVRMEDMSGDLMLKEYALDNLIKQALKKYSRMLPCRNWHYIMKHFGEPLRQMKMARLYWMQICPMH